MKKIFSTFRDSLRKYLGHPVQLYRLLEEHPDITAAIEEPENTIALGSVVPWHTWSRPMPFNSQGQLTGWKRTNGHYRQCRVYRSAFANFGGESTRQWTCDIQDIAGFSSSKSALEMFTSLDDMVAKDSPELIADISETSLRRHLAHREIRILHDNDPSDHFVRHLWDGRIFLANAGGSHHLAAARSIAARIGQKVPLKGRLRTCSIHEAAVDLLCHDFDLFAISGAHEIRNGFRLAMESFSATYFFHDMPKPYHNLTAILLPKNEPRSRRISSVLSEAGTTDLGQYFARLCARQTANQSRVRP
ncbi:MAG: hypothetical protein P4L42_04885 [Desulfocapsaceae bacterium]|nr:hypothetical protein [Desulfocapsaceae bacterium]